MEWGCLEVSSIGSLVPFFGLIGAQFRIHIYMAFYRCDSVLEWICVSGV